MKKIYCLLIVAVISLFGVVEVNAESPIKSINFCNIVTLDDVSHSVRLSMPNNSCNVSVELSDDSYTVVSGEGDVQFQDGQNVHNIVVKDTNGNETTYPINVSFNAAYNGSNPQTGDISLSYVIAGIVCLGAIAICYNKRKKCSKELA